jgi:hypothetical protein
MSQPNLGALHALADLDYAFVGGPSSGSVAGGNGGGTAKIAGQRFKPVV